ncbi:MAG: hypothetical protein R3F49_16905 [Planctomycetota bacterium]
MRRHAQVLWLCVALALTTRQLAAHGYGTRPPWVSAGVVRTLAPAGDAYLELRVQHGGHIGARGALSAPDVFRIVRLAGPHAATGLGTVTATARWQRERGRRPLQHTPNGVREPLLGSGALARGPLALALFPGGEALAVADRAGLCVQEPDGGLRFEREFQALVEASALEDVREEHGRNHVWPFAWLDAPPRTVALWTDGSAVAFALRATSGAWELGAVDAASGAPLEHGRADAVLRQVLESTCAPEASIALEVLAERLCAARASGRGAEASGLASLLEAAKRVLANEHTTVEAQLVAARILALFDGDAAQRAMALERALGVLRSGDGHPSMDDLLAATVVCTLARRAPSDVALVCAPGDLAALALARGVPELLPALRFMPGGVSALAGVWTAVDAGRLSPYADARTTGALVITELGRALGEGADGAAERTLELRQWAGDTTRRGPTLAGFRPDDEARRALVLALRDAEPRLAPLSARDTKQADWDLVDLAGPSNGAGLPARDPRAELVRGLAVEFPAVLDLTGSATRELVGALIEALEDTAPRGGPDRVARADASLRRIVDVPPAALAMGDALDAPASIPVGSPAAAAAWRAWWRSASGRPQAAELAALADGPASARFGVPDAALARAVADVLGSDGTDAWRVLAAGLGRALDRVDELGLRGPLVRGLREPPPRGAAASDLDAEQDARAALARALGGASERT